MAKRRRRGKRSRFNPMANGPRATIAIGSLALAASGGYYLYKRNAVPKAFRSCGRKYLHLVVTSQGQTLEHPYTWPPTFSDFEAWKALARKLMLDAQARWYLLGEVECEASGGTNCSDRENAQSPNFARWNELLSLNNGMVDKYEALPSIYTGSVPESIGQAQNVIADAICLMQRSDEGIKHYGGTIPETPGTLVGADEGTPWYVWSALGGAALVAGGLAAGAVFRAPNTAGTTVVIREDDDDEDAA